MQDSTQDPKPAPNGGFIILTVDCAMLLVGLAAVGIAYAGLVYWFSSYANGTSASAGAALSPFLLALLGAFVAGATLIGALRDGDGDGGPLSWASRLGFVAAAGFVAVGGIVPEFREAQEGADWAVFKWVALAAFYGGSGAIALSVVLVLWRLSRVRTVLRSGLGGLTIPSFPVPRVSRPRLVVRGEGPNPPIVGE